MILIIESWQNFGFTVQQFSFISFEVIKSPKIMSTGTKQAFNLINRRKFCEWTKFLISISIRLDSSNEPLRWRRLMRKVGRAMSNWNLKLVTALPPHAKWIFWDSQLCRWRWMRWAVENVMSCHRIMYERDINHREILKYSIHLKY